MHRGPRDPNLQPGDAATRSPEVSTGQPAEPMTLASPQLKRLLLLYYLGVVVAVAFIGYLVLDGMELTPGPAGGTGQAHAPSLVSVFTLIALAGALGGALHGLSSFEAFAGRGVLYGSWLPFYLGRPFLGSGMAISMGLILCAGLLGGRVDHSTNSWTLVAWGVLSGLFSTSALKKLSELFDVAFQTRQQESRPAGQLGARAPLLETAAPLSISPVEKPPKPA
ncbi:MAG TPA: hypothetical protein VFA20_16980 [Myxococcaceae bacterium]|nr:hypothetical protein [Myxococcaceae bacterium]